MLKKKPVTGMKDILPGEMRLREYVLDVMRKTYESCGFVSIETPCVEHLENLNSKQGGENEKLIFKILKRGEKLDIASAKEENDLCDGGLRYDLTVPLCRYYAEHANELPSPFKALQTGSVWRADRPQRGRFRQFVQCDIDIIGDESNLAEIELIGATSTFLRRIGFKNFTIKINDRRILKAMAMSAGFDEASCDEIFIILDKMDKIGREGVTEELKKEGFDGTCAERYLELVCSFGDDADAAASAGERLKGYLDEGVAGNLACIMRSVPSAGEEGFDIKFDPSLVRGMGYYTGPVFEITVNDFGSSVGGGGRYDAMIGRFTGNDVPACGFSVGFERIIMLMAENGFEVPDAPSKKAYLLDKKLSEEKKLSVLKEAALERAKGRVVTVTLMKKNKKFQKEQLSAEGYTEITEVFGD